MANLTASLGSAWSQYTSAVAEYEAFDFHLFSLSALPVCLSDLISAVFGALFVRSAIRYRAHWLRLLVVTWICVTGGTTVVALLIGNKPRWLSTAAVSNALLLGYWLAFHFPGDVPRKILKHRKIAPIFDKFVRPVGMALSISAFSIERVLESVADGRWGAKPPSVFTFLCVGVIAGAGGSMIAELWNLFLASKQQFHSPQHGASGAAVQALLGSLLYTVLLRDAAGLGTASLLGCGWLHRYQDKANAVAALSMCMVILAAVPPQLLSQRFHAMLDLVPGWKSVCVPANIGAQPGQQPPLTTPELFGYQPLTDLYGEVYLEESEILEVLKPAEELDVDLPSFSNEVVEGSESEGGEESSASETDGSSDIETTPAPTPLNGSKRSTAAALAPVPVSIESTVSVPKPTRAAAKGSKAAKAAPPSPVAVSKATTTARRRAVAK